MSDHSGLPDGSPFFSHFKQLTRPLIDTVLDFVFPPRCLGCKDIGSLLCDRCQAKIDVPVPIREASSPLTERRATAEFEGVIQQAIHQLKYENQRRYAVPLGQRLTGELSRSGWQPTMITAAPLHEARLRSRGYNQSAELAVVLSQQANLPFDPKIIWRVRDTRPQVGLNYQERQSNVAGAFEGDAQRVGSQRIVLIDDVYTTGATLSACARALLDAGASTVWALTVASARRLT